MTKEQLENYQTIKQEAAYLHRKASSAKWREDDRADILQNHWQEKTAEADEALLSIEAGLAILDPEERQILRLRYIEGMSWTQVALRSHYGRSTVFRIHARALKKLNK